MPYKPSSYTHGNAFFQNKDFNKYF